MTDTEKLFRISEGLRREALEMHADGLELFIDAKHDAVFAVSDSHFQPKALEEFEEGLIDSLRKVRKARESLQAAIELQKTANDIEQNPSDFLDEIGYYERFLK